MKTYKVIAIKQGIMMSVNKLAEKIELLLNEKCNAGWELVDINYVFDSLQTTAFLTFRY